MKTFITILLLVGSYLHGQAPAKDKPVKVYILSGQSNMVGMGDVKPANPQYSKMKPAKQENLAFGDSSARLSVWLEEVKFPEILTQTIGSTTKTQ